MQMGPHRDTHACMKLYKEDDMESYVYMYTCTDAYAHSDPRCGDHRRGDWDTHGGNTESYTFVCNYQMSVEQM